MSSEREENGEQITHQIDSAAHAVPDDFSAMAVYERVLDNEHYFSSDENKLIDLVLVYRTSIDDTSKEKEKSKNESKSKKLVGEVRRRLYRQRFEKQCIEVGLELETVGEEKSRDGKTVYVKVHGPWAFLSRMAEFNKIKVPIQVAQDTHLPFELKGCCKKRDDYKGRPSYYTAAFDRRHMDMFLMSKQPAAMFTPTQRIYLVVEYIKRIRVPFISKKNLLHILSRRGSVEPRLLDGMNEEEEDTEQVPEVDIDWLLRHNVYSAIFPLNDSEVKAPSRMNDPCKHLPPAKWPLRRWLYENWSRLSCLLRSQPLDEIYDYCGPKLAMYFAWIGFYTQALILPAIFGAICFAYGVAKEVIDLEVDVVNTGARYCDYGNISTQYVCRACPDDICRFHSLKDQCEHSQLSGIFDNYLTAVYAVFISIWACYFVETWQQRQTVLSLHWNATITDTAASQKPRSEFAAKVTTTRTNPVTMKKEPYLQGKMKHRRLAPSVVITLCFIGLVLALGVSVLVYRAASRAFFFNYENKHPDLNFLPATSLGNITASLLSALIIIVMQYVWSFVAEVITNYECPRTDEDYERSYIYKVTAFQFVNYYGGVFYLAFVKGKINERPTFGTNIDISCSVGGCMSEVFMQLLIVMTGKQILNNFVEVGKPMLLNWWRRLRAACGAAMSRGRSRKGKPFIWEQDYILNARPRLLDTFDDYLEIVIQYGFLVLFTAAFPLAGLFSWVNNIVEIRLDATKTLTMYRRPWPNGARSIGPWMRILRIFTQCAVITNALIIAFTTHFIDNIMYDMVYKDRGVNMTAMIYNNFDTSLWDNPALRLDADGMNVTTCLYNARYAFSRHQFKDQLSPQVNRYFILCARLVFVLFFFVLMKTVQFFVAANLEHMPDVVKHQQLREQHIIRQSFMAHEQKNKQKDEQDNKDDEHTEKDHTEGHLQEQQPTNEEDFKEDPVDELDDEEYHDPDVPDSPIAKRANRIASQNEELPLTNDNNVTSVKKGPVIMRLVRKFGLFC